MNIKLNVYMTLKSRSLSIEGAIFTFYLCHVNKTGAPARTVGWRDPGFIHTGFLKELWPNSGYVTMFLILLLLP